MGANLTLELKIWFSSVQLLSHVRLFVTTWIAARQASLSITDSRSSVKLTSIESVMPSSYTWNYQDDFDRSTDNQFQDDC